MSRLRLLGVFAAAVATLFAGFLALAQDAVPKANKKGLAAHYYQDPTNWNGKWPDDSPIPSADPGQWTFSNYAYSRVESLISHQFINSGWFTVRWQGELDTHPRPEADTGAASYEFEIWADDGCRLYIDGNLLIDSWIPCAEDSPNARRPATAVLTPGKHEIVVEYFQGQSLKNGDRDPIKLYWTCAERKIPKQLIPASHFGHTAAHLVPEAGRLD